MVYAAGVVLVDPRIPTLPSARPRPPHGISEFFRLIMAGNNLDAFSCLMEDSVICEPDCSKFDTSGCEHGCVKDCMGRECGPDPVCGFSCGTCDTGYCNPDGQCESSCVKDCTGRECGPDPVCGESCGVCTAGQCNSEGQCEEVHGSGPDILMFSTNVTHITEDQTVTFSAIVTDPDGIDDLIGGNLGDPGGGTYGTFATTAQEGAYQMTLSWDDIGYVRPIQITGGLAQRSFEARFFDQAGNQATGAVAIDLVCPGQDGATCPDNVCVDLAVSQHHCGSCFNEVPHYSLMCENGQFVCDDSSYELHCGTFCSYLDSWESCGSCDKNCSDRFQGTYWSQTSKCVDESRCFYEDLRNFDRIPCDQVCVAENTICLQAYAKYYGYGNTLSLDCDETPPENHPTDHGAYEQTRCDCIDP